mgnify:CR=1 FL=1
MNMADVAAVLDTAGLAGLKAGKLGHKKASPGNEPAGFNAAIIAHLSAAEGKGKPAAQDPGLVATIQGFATQGSGATAPDSARGKKPSAGFSDAFQAPVVGQQPGPSGAEAALAVAAPVAGPAAEVSSAAAAPAAAEEGATLQGAARTPAPLARTVQALADNLARDLPDTAAVERDKLIPQLPGERVTDSGKGGARLAHGAAMTANAADPAGRNGQVLPQLAGAVSQNDAGAFQDSSSGGGDGLLSPDVRAASSSATPETSLARPFDQLLRHAEARLNAAVEAPVRSPAFAAELGDKVVWLAGRNAQVAELTLNPPQMGTLEIRLTVTGGEVAAHFFSANPVGRDALETALPRLRELMNQAGINLGEANVRDQAFAQGGGAGQATSRDGGSFGGTEVARDGGMHAVAYRSAGVGLVDLYA